MKYLVCEQQNGEGCDYTIGCGMTYSIWEADSEEDLIEQVLYPDGKEGWCSLEGEEAREEILYVPADNLKSLDIHKLKEDLNEAKEKQNQQDLEDKDREEFDR